MFPLRVDLTDHDVTDCPDMEVEAVLTTPTDAASTAEAPAAAADETVDDSAVSMEVIEDTATEAEVPEVENPAAAVVIAVSDAEVATNITSGTALSSKASGSTEAPKKPRAPRKKKMSAKAIALAAAKLDAAPEAEAADPVDAVAGADEAPPPLLKVALSGSPMTAEKPIEKPKPAAIAKPAAISKPVVALSPLVEDKVNTYRLKARALAEELDMLQNRGAEFDSDRHLNLESLIDETVVLLVHSWQTSGDSQKPAPREGAMDAVTEGASPSEPALAVATFGEAPDPLTVNLNKILCCVIQGSCSPLSALVVDVKKSLSQLMSSCVAVINEGLSGSDGEGKIGLTELSVHLLALHPGSGLLKALFNFESQTGALSELRVVINSVALREAHGFRGKDAIAFEDTDLLGIWAWEVTKKESTFSKEELAIVKECCSNRRRYGRAVKAFMDSLEQLQKSASLDNPKVLQAEEKASKAFAEVEKAKEKRMEAERKKQVECRERVAREQAKEEKLREKEEVLRRKKEVSALETTAAADKKREAEERKAEERAAVEAEKKLIEDKKEKQRKMMQGFFVSKPKPIAPALAPSSSSADALLTAEVYDLSGDNAVQQTTALAIKKKRTFDEAAFEIIARGEEVDRSAVLRSFRQRHIAMKESGKSNPFKKRPKVKIQVPVEVSNGDVFGAESYTELTDKYIDGKMKLFQFHEYEKTKYWGTFSKKSVIVRGRTFNKRDEELRNYDVDSAEEWEDDEEVGEDIIDSDDDKDPDEPNEPNELVYDDFFRHDDDFGSDNEEDGVRANIPRFAVVGKSVAGPRFIQTSPVYHDAAGALADSISPSNKPLDSEVAERPALIACSFDNDGNMVRCADMDKDVSRLLNFFTVVYPEAIADAAPAAVSNPAGESSAAPASAADAAAESVPEKAKGLSVEQVCNMCLIIMIVIMIVIIYVD
jgi:hypothetical protein